MNVSQRSANGSYPKLEYCTEPLILSEQLNEFGKRRYWGFDNYQSLEKFVLSKPKLSLHEVTRCGKEGIQRIFFDIDAEYTKFPGSTKEQIIRAYDLLLEEITDVMRIHMIADTSYYKLINHRDSKFSVHIVFKQAYIDSLHYKCFYSHIMNSFALRILAEKLPIELTNIVDAKVYDKSHNLRIHTSRKFGTKNRLILENESNAKFDVKTMVTYFPAHFTKKSKMYKCGKLFPCTSPKSQKITKITGNQMETAEQILNNMKEEGVTVAKLDKPFIRLNIDHSKPCAVCGNKHDSENMMAVVDDKCLKLICRRQEKGSPNRYRTLHKFVNNAVDVSKSIYDMDNTIVTKSQYFPPITSINKTWRTLFMLGELGSGKTKQMIDYIIKLMKETPDFRCIMLTYRVNLAAAIFKRVNDEIIDENDYFETYKELLATKISLDMHKKLVIQYESVNRLNPGDEPVDLVVIDEATSFAQQTLSGLNKRMDRINQMMLRGVLRSAKQVIITDALLDSPTVEAYQHILNSDTVSSINNTVIWINEPVTYWSPVVDIHESEITWKTALITDIKNNQKIYISTTHGEIWSKSMANYILKRSPTSRILCIYGGNSDNERIMKNINEELQKYDIVIASPCMSAGISFDIKDYFDKVYAYVDSFGPTAIDIIQSLRRVRHTKTNEIIICDSTSVMDLPTSYKDIYNKLERKLKYNHVDFIKQGFMCDIRGNEYYFENPESPALKFKIACMRINNLNRINIIDTVINYIKSKHGIIRSNIKAPEIKTDANKADLKEFDLLIHKEKSSHFAEIARTSLVTKEEYEALKGHVNDCSYYTEIIGDGTILLRQIIKARRNEKPELQMEKYQLLNFYGLAHTDFPCESYERKVKEFNKPDKVELYSKWNVMKCYREIRYRDLPIDVVRKLDEDATQNMEDADKVDYNYKSGRHETICAIRKLFVDGKSDYGPVLELIKKLYDGKIPEFSRCKEPNNRNILSMVNSIIWKYGYRVESKRIRNGKKQVSVMIIKDYSNDLFEIKYIKYQPGMINIHNLQSGENEKPVAIIYK